MSFQIKLLVVMASLGSSGCFHLSDRKIADQDMGLTPDTVEVLAGDYRVMLDEHSHSESHWFSTHYGLISDLEAKGHQPGFRPAALSVRLSNGKIWLTLKYQGEWYSHFFDYHLSGNELRFDVVEVKEVGWLALIPIGETTEHKMAGLGRRRDGKLWMRCHSTTVSALLFLVPIYWGNDETTVYFDPVPSSPEPEVSD